MDAFSLGAEQTQYLDRAAAVTTEPMRVSGVEFSSFTRTHHDVVIGQLYYSKTYLNYFSI